MKITELIGRLMSPPRCMACGNLLDFKANVMLCDECCQKMPEITGKTCPRCGRPVPPNHEATQPCGYCRRFKQYFRSNVAMFRYQGNAAEVIRKMKFGTNNIWIADNLGHILSERLARVYGNIRFDGVAAVPISRRRMMERHFNQCEVIAEAVAADLGLEYMPDLLKKLKDTPRQSGLKRSERIKNVKGAFAVSNPEMVENKIILLIDDVYTTGSTINECARILIKAGARGVYCGTAAIVKYD